MRYTYCQDCDDAFAKTMFEKNRCIYCGKENTTPVNINSISYYIGYFLLLVGAASIVILDDSTYQWPVLIISFIVGLIMTVRSKINMKDKAITLGKSQIEK